MEHQELATLNRATGYYLALYDYKLYDTDFECAEKALRTFQIDDSVMRDEFYTTILNLIPPDEFY